MTVRNACKKISHEFVRNAREKCSQLFIQNAHTKVLSYILKKMIFLLKGFIQF